MRLEEREGCAVLRVISDPPFRISPVVGITPRLTLLTPVTLPQEITLDRHSIHLPSSSFVRKDHIQHLCPHILPHFHQFFFISCLRRPFHPYFESVAFDSDHKLALTITTNTSSRFDSSGLVRIHLQTLPRSIA